MDARMFDEFYESMSPGDMQHMANRLYKYEGIVPQKVARDTTVRQMKCIEAVRKIQVNVESLQDSIEALMEEL